jgi:polysaccharide biosynthesis transport protein
MAQSSQSGIDAAVGALRRRRWLAVSAFALVLAGAVTIAASLPNLYQSTATVLVERTTGDASEDVDSRLQRIRQEILSRTRLAELIARFDLYPDLRSVASQEAVVTRMRRDIRIDVAGSDLATGRGTIALSVAYRGRDPKKVTEVANALSTTYIEEDSVLRNRQTSGAASVLQTQIEEVKQRLTQQEKRIADFKKSHAGSLPQQADTSLLAMERIQGRIQRVTDAHAAAVERRETLLREGDASAKGEGDPDRERLEKLRAELADLKTRYSDKYPDVISKKAEVETLAATVSAKPQVDRSLPQLEALNREIRNLQAEESRLRGETSMYQRRIDGAPWLEQEYQALSRDYASTRDFYDSLLKRYEEAQLAEARGGTPRGQLLRLLDPAITPVDPLAPDRVQLAILGLIAAVALGFIAVAAAERLDTSFHSVDELKAHSRVPVLVRIPQLPSRAPIDRAKAIRRAVALSGALAVALAATVGASRAFASDNEDVVVLLAPRGRS